MNNNIFNRFFLKLAWHLFEFFFFSVRFGLYLMLSDEEWGLILSVLIESKNNFEFYVQSIKKEQTDLTTADRLIF